MHGHTPPRALSTRPEASSRGPGDHPFGIPPLHNHNYTTAHDNLHGLDHISPVPAPQPCWVVPHSAPPLWVTHLTAFAWHKMLVRVAAVTRGADSHSGLARACWVVWEALLGSLASAGFRVPQTGHSADSHPHSRHMGVAHSLIGVDDGSRLAFAWRKMLIQVAAVDHGAVSSRQ